MKKILFEAELKGSLKKLRAKLGPEISNEKMFKVVASSYCGALCKHSCSYWCSPIGLGQESHLLPPEDN